MSRTARRCLARAAFAAALVWMVAHSRAVALADAADISSVPPAEQLAAQAYELHAAGKHAEAIAAYLKAYEASNAGVILYNIATIYDRKLHERELAAEYYRRYLGAPDAEPDLVEKATRRLTALKIDHDNEEQARTLEPMAGAAPPAPRGEDVPKSISEPKIAAPPQPTGVNVWQTGGLVAGSVGLAGITASLILGAAALSKDRQADAVCRGPACSSEAGVRLAQDAGRLATASTVAFIVGLGLTAGGVTMLVVAPRPSQAPRSALALTPAIALGIAGVSVRGGF